MTMIFTPTIDGRKTKPKISAEEKRRRDKAAAQRRRDRLVASGLTTNGTSPKIRRRVDGWPVILERAAAIVRSYSTLVTLRQLFYRLVSVATLRNTISDYQNLSKYSAEARRAGTFPALLDRTSEIQIPATWDSPQELVEAAREQYRRDRTEGQANQVWLVVEKSGLIAQLDDWFGDRGLPMAALSGYSSQTDADTIRRLVRADGRAAILLYGGDFDPSGEDILRDFRARSRCWSEVRRVALTADQVTEYGLPELPGKWSDARASRFVARHGRLAQVEIDALDPNDLRDLFEIEIDAFWDQSAFEESMAREEREREAIVFVESAS
jgi:hypothetical protein